MIVYPYYMILVFEYKNKEYEKYKLKRWTLQCYCLFTIFSMENEYTI